jgi:GNAT superfamily N-acetyltransferase
MKLPLAASFVDRGSGERVSGVIRVPSDQDLLLWTGWRYRPTDEDRGWDWWGIYLDCRVSPGRYECYAALALDDLQGLAVLDMETKRTIAGNAITVDYLSTNPANRNLDRGLKHVGLALMAAAIARSRDHGTRGSLRLESLPGAAGFYENLGMVRQHRRSAEGNLVYLLEPGTAEQLLDEIKAQGILVT